MKKLGEILTFLSSISLKKKVLPGWLLEETELSAVQLVAKAIKS